MRVDDLTNLQTATSTSVDQVGRLNTQPKDKKELVDTAKKLEGVFLSMMVKQMRQSMSEDGLFGEGSHGEVLGGMFDQMMGEELSERSALGIAELVVRSALKREDGRHFTALEMPPERARLLHEQLSQPAKPQPNVQGGPE